MTSCETSKGEQCECNLSSESCDVLPMLYSTDRCVSITALDSANTVGQTPEVYIKDEQGKCVLYAKYHAYTDTDKQNKVLQRGNVCFYNTADSCWKQRNSVFADSKCKTEITVESMKNEHKDVTDVFIRGLNDICEPLGPSFDKSKLNKDGYEYPLILYGANVKAVLQEDLDGKSSYYECKAASGKDSTQWKDVLQDCDIPQSLNPCGTVCGLTRGSEKCSTRVSINAGESFAQNSAFCHRRATCPERGKVRGKNDNPPENASDFFTLRNSYCGLLQENNQGSRPDSKFF